ncbi:MAG: replicative DNA helicase [Phycisphaeraceae bacterium]|nr:replicative DNA helicase [Phycisphaeraceae bacterium]
MDDTSRTGRRAFSNRPGPNAESFAKLYERPLPYSLEAEMALLGSMLLDPRVLSDVMSIVTGADDFYSEAHAAIFQAVHDVYDKIPDADLVPILDTLRDRGKLELVGGGEYLAKLANETPSAAGAVRYAKTVADKARLRRLIEAADRMIYDALNAGEFGVEGAGEIIDAAESAVFEIAQENQRSDPQALADLLARELERIQAAEGVGISGVATGFLDLDKLLSGMQNGEMIILAARPSMGKCLAFDSEIVRDDGAVVTIEELFRSRQGSIATLNEHLKLTQGTPSDFIDDGRKPVFEVTTRLGRRVRTTITHPFLTIDGWRPLGQLREGEMVAVPRRLEIFGRETWRDCEVKLLGYLIGDGGLTGPTPRFTNSNLRIADDFAAAATEFGGVQLTLSSTRQHEAPSWRIVGSSDGIGVARTAFARTLREVIRRRGLTQREVAKRVGVSPASVTHWTNGAMAPDEAVFDRLCVVLGVEACDLASEGIAAARTNTPNALTRWLESLGLAGADAARKHVPPGVFTLERRQVALFLNRLFATDGWATVLASGQAQLGYSTVSERLARQVQHLLLRFGVIASLRLRWVKYRDARRPAWQLDITDAAAIRTFIEEIGIFGKEEALARVMEALSKKKYQTNRDLIPIDVWRHIDTARGERSWRSIAEEIGAPGENLHAHRRRPARARLAKLAEAMDDGRLRDLAASDVYWDEIVSIVPLGEQQVYDLTMPGTHNFIANDVCVHNTAMALNLAEQIARGGRTPDEPAKGPHVPVGLFSLEMSKSSIVQRLLSAFSQIDSHRIRTGHLNAHEMTSLRTHAEGLLETPLFIDDTPGLTVLQLRARARRMAAQHGIRAIFIDYLQLLSSPGASRESRQVEVSAISRGIKALARELNIPIVCLSQLNRASEQREGNRPRMSDLRESGSIEQDADVVMLLHREDYYHQGNEAWLNDPENADKIGVAELIVAKQRNGPTGVVKLTWDSKTTRFRNHAGTGWAGGGFAGGGFGGAGFGNYGGTAASELESKPNRPPEYNGGFPMGDRTGPVENFRDGGGPDRDDDEPSPF